MKSTKITKKQEIKICEEYKKGNFLSDLMKKYRISYKKIKLILNNYNIKIRNKYTFPKQFSCDNDYFEKINNPDKAYFLGMLYADGYIDKNRKYIRISLTESDKEVLDFLKKSINHTGELKKIYFSKYNKKKYTSRDSFCLHIFNKKITNDLINLGCIPNKSFTLEFPTFNQIPKYLMGHFIRGYFDGDGCISIMSGSYKNGKRAKIAIIGSCMFIDKLNKFLHKKNINSSYLTFAKNPKIKYLWIARNDEIKNFYNFIYNNCTFSLERKKNKFIEYFKQRNIILN